MLEDDGQDAFYLGMDAFDDAEGQWTNPFHPSMEREKYLDWKDGWAYALEIAFPPEHHEQGAAGAPQKGEGTSA